MKKKKDSYKDWADKQKKAEEEKTHKEISLSKVNVGVRKDSVYTPIVQSKVAMDNVENMIKEGYKPSADIQSKIDWINDVNWTSEKKYHGNLTDAQIKKINELTEEISKSANEWSSKKNH